MANQMHITLDGRLSQRVDPSTWNKIKAYMVYLDSEDLEDQDIFDVPSGWYVSRGDEEKVEEILGIPAELRFAYRKQQAEQEEQKRKRKEAEHAEEIARKKQAYKMWEEQILAGLEEFHEWIDNFPVKEWEPVAFVEKEVDWSDTGDSWSKAIWNDQIIYRHSYGNTVRYFSTRENVVKLARLALEEKRKFYQTEVDMARHILMRHDKGCIGDSSAQIVVEEDGIQKYIHIARSESWYLAGKDKTSEEWQTIAKYQLPAIPLIIGVSIHSLPYKKMVEAQKYIAEKMGTGKTFGYAHYSGVYYLPEEDRWFVTKGLSSVNVTPAPDLSKIFPELKKR